MRSALMYNFLIEANIMASIAIVLLLPLRKFLRRQLGNRALCFGWLLVATRLLCPLSLPNPVIGEIRSPFAGDAAIRPIAGQVKVRVVDALYAVGRMLQSGGNRQGYKDMQWLASSVDYNGGPRVMAWVLLGGMAAVLCWFLVSNLWFRHRLKANRVEEISGELKAMYLLLCRERGVKPVPVYFTDPVPAACLVGVVRPYIALPLLTAPQDVKNVLAHEICHLKNRDHLWTLVRLLCCAVHWFNPLVWLAASLSRTDCELRCDDTVTAMMDQEEKQAYAGVLVMAAARRGSPGLGVMATGMTMTGRRLKNRVQAILHGRKNMRGFAMSFMIVASACLIGAFATAEVSKTWNMIFPDNDEKTKWTLDAEMLRYYADDQEALDAYGLGLWESASLREENAHAPFAISHSAEEETWTIADSGEGLELVYNAEGNLIELLNLRSHVLEAAEVPLTNTETPMNQLTVTVEDIDETVQGWIGRFVKSFRPDLANERNYTQLMMEYRFGNTWFAQFALRRMGTDREDDYLAMIELETSPEIRVVWLTTQTEEMPNPGNG